ncbi:PREDICTED: U-box domain-containing protein 33-like isoform X2 [Nelumbo nucifera]|uniref:RING-type E3 ubiquitin transferase n=1 Tax=Nelumbo nucifera TaxID=4432 RepID=A0A1U8A2G0_NELNU|nr:PREDICTED: U-box domain-containing protein 33-like isoform X2 [Nelumbo nucifera]
MAARKKVPRHVGISGLMERGGEIEEDFLSHRNIYDKIFVAVGKEVKENESTLLWTLKNSRGKKICILHVHQPAQFIPGPMGTKFPASKVKEQEVGAYRELEEQRMHNILNEYLVICINQGVWAEKLVIENDDIKKGIVELITRHGIKNLVMGAAADKKYSKRMTDLKSKKAIYVREKAHFSCYIWFVCKGFLICTREREGIFVSPPILPSSPFSEISQQEYLKSLSFPQAQVHSLALSNPYQSDFGQARSLQYSTHEHGEIGAAFSSHEGSGRIQTPERQLSSEGIAGELEGISGKKISQGSEDLTWPSNEEAISVREDQSDDGSGLISWHDSSMELRYSSPANRQLLDEGRGNGNMYDQMKKTMEKAIEEAEKAKKEAWEESTRRQEAEMALLEAQCRAKHELKQREEIEELRAKEKQELESMKRHQGKVLEDLRIAQDQNSELERTLEELEQKFFSAVELLISLKSERDQLRNAVREAKNERDQLRNAGREAKGLRRSEEEGENPENLHFFSKLSLSEEGEIPENLHFFSKLSLSEIEEAARNFDPSLKIGEGANSSVFKGLLHHTPVAIKMFHSNSSQAHMKFQREVDVLSRMRHPNLVNLIGVCPEACSLVYEYLPNGSLEDRLTCKDNTPPLSWQTRTLIATGICSALIFLQSNALHRVVHGDLKPANILLDTDFVSKLSDFGICCCLFPRKANSASSSTQCHETNPKGVLAHMDPEFLDTGELIPMSDVYSFGIVLLRLLTGRPAMGIVEEVQHALDKGKLKQVLDGSAGNWPFVQAQQLAHLALRCCERNLKSRPNLASEVWRVLEPMRASCRTSSPFCLGSGEHCRAPSYFICPIFQEVMQDPHVAADGYTYEAEGIRAWLDSGHDTSPMTNLKLANRNLIPNYALRSAIQEWRHQ